MGAPFEETVRADPDDQKVLELAAIGAADVLVTGDRALLDLAAVSAFAIKNAADFKKRFLA